MNHLNLRGIKIFCYTAILCVSLNQALGQSSDDLKNPLSVERCDDFEITGSGNNEFWDLAEWNSLTQLDHAGRDHETKFKILASPSGIYVLFYGEDDRITTKDYGDMEKIWNGDVFEIFFHPDPKEPEYYEYEVNQFEKQLVLTISDSKGGMSWVPFNEYGKDHYGIKCKVDISGGAQELDGTIESWSAEVFLSYKSLGLLPRVPPESGTVWNANFCRLDYDTGNMVKWSWTPTIKSSFHELDKFRSIVFK